MKGIVRLLTVSLLTCVAFKVSAQASDDYPPVSVFSRSIKVWANACTVVRGPQKIDEPLLGKASFGEDNEAGGPADNVVVSLGDGGMAIISFGQSFSNNPGPDFAVFENSFDGRYLELAFVEVSSDSIKWIRFPSRSDIPTATQTGIFGITDPGMLHNLAGKYPAMFGTPFFLEDISDSAGIDLQNVRFIRIIDVIGTINPLYCSYDSRGIPVNDPWPTPFPQSGFDLDAVALTDISLLSSENESFEAVNLFPNPVNDRLMVELPAGRGAYLRVRDTNGRLAGRFDINENVTEISLGYLCPGMYIAEILFRDGSPTVFKRFVKL